MDCKRCGAPLNQGVVLCSECGARQRRRAGAVRCAGCHKSVPLGLTVCPHCGRNVRPAGPRWGWWIAGFTAIVLVSLWGLDKLPIARVVHEVQVIRDRVSGLIEVLGPVSSPVPVPADTPNGQALVAMVTQTPPPSPTPTPTPSPTANATSTTEARELEDASDEPEPELIEETTVTPTPELTSTPTQSHTPTPAATGTTTYRVQTGDTLSSIATRFGITWEALAAANGLTGTSVLRIGQELIVPLPGSSLPPTPTATPRPRPTATQVAPTPLPQLAAPVLVDPGDQTPFSGAGAFIELTWEAVQGTGSGDQYQVVVRWLEQGAPQEHYWFRTVAGSPLPPWLWGRADQPARKYTWYVRVVRVTTDGQGGELVIPLSPPSQSRVFYWN